MADRRREQGRREHGDESDPDVRAFLERISPLNNAENITVPLSIAHGEEDSRVPVGEALRMWDIASKKVYIELMVCEVKGHITSPGERKRNANMGGDFRVQAEERD
jgi:dipeptidyl aminopeptidase/acylaminoacyl peptidase